MSLSLLAKPNRSAAIGKVVAEGQPDAILIQFDASISERFSRRKDVTQHPVEAGSDISDHSRTLPLEITIRGWVTDDPIIVLASVNATPSVAGGSINARVANAWKELNRIMDEESIVKVISGLDSFDNMILKSLDVTRDKNTGRILDATISLEQITIATTEVIEIPTPRPEPGQGSSNRARKTKNGKKVSKTPRDQSFFEKVYKKGKSLLAL